MSWLYSQALVEDYRRAKSSAGEPFAPWKTTPMPEMFLSHAKTTEALSLSQSGMRCEPLPGTSGADLLTWFRADSLAKTSVRRARERESKVSVADYGVRWRVLSVKFDPVTSSWKTPPSLFGEGLTSCLPTLPRWGLMRGGELWERITPPPLTSARESGFWATPTTESGGELGAEMLERLATSGRRESGARMQICLRDQVRDRRLWATPTVCGNYNKKGASQTSGNGLATQVSKTEISARLNPDWVEWLMGWRIGWSSLEACERKARSFEIDPAESGEIPRVTLEKRARRARLRVLGNGQVPQAAALAWRILIKEKGDAGANHHHH